MTTSAKIVLLLVALLVGGLALYYGFLGEDPSPLADEADESGGSSVEEQQFAEADEAAADEDERSPSSGQPGFAARPNDEPLLPDPGDGEPAVGSGASSRGGGQADSDGADETAMPVDPDESADHRDPGEGVGDAADESVADGSATDASDRVPDDTDVQPVVGPEPPESLDGQLPMIYTGDLRASGKGDSGDAPDDGSEPADGTVSESPSDPEPDTPDREISEAEESGSPEYTEYTVQARDSLWTIAASWFGDGSKWDLIARANPTIDPQHLREGMVLRLPPRDAESSPVDRSESRSDAQSDDGGVQYVVRSGDTLSSIARVYYGSESLWHRIYEANREAIGDDPKRLQVDMRLTIPPAPDGARGD